MVAASNQQSVAKWRLKTLNDLFSAGSIAGIRRWAGNNFSCRLTAAGIGRHDQYRDNAAVFCNMAVGITYQPYQRSGPVGDRASSKSLN